MGHRSYTETEIATFRSTPIENVLSDLGYNVQHTHSGLYYSPFHNEKTPSFHIDRESNRWFDHGNRNPDQKAGGDVFDLVMALKGIDFQQTCEYLGTLNPSVSPEEEIISDSGKPYQGKSSFKIDRTYDSVLSPLLRDYANLERHIPLNILNRYCSQVNYSITYADGHRRPRFAIGFPNIDGNWALRSSLKAGGKLSTGSNITVIRADGSFVSNNETIDGKIPVSAQGAAVFEGFMDFMSWLAWNRIETPSKADAVVLNSVTNAKKAVDFLAAHGKVISYLDNDEAGETTTEFLRKALEEKGVAFVDARTSYKGFDDVNEAWIQVDRKRQMEAFKEQQTNKKKIAEPLSGPHIK